MYGPAARRKTDLQDDEREVLHQCIRPRMWSMLLRASMGIRAHPRLTSGKASVDHYGTQSRWLRRADRSSISSFHLADLGGEAVEPTELLNFTFYISWDHVKPSPRSYRRSLARSDRIGER